MAGTFRAAVLLACALCSTGGAAWADTAAAGTGDVEYGAYLAQECSACHGDRAGTTGIPAIAGASPDYILEALLAYKNGERPDATMRSIARSLDDEAMAALAAYYARE